MPGVLFAGLSSGWKCYSVESFCQSFCRSFCQSFCRERHWNKINNIHLIHLNTFTTLESRHTWPQLQRTNPGTFLQWCQKQWFHCSPILGNLHKPPCVCNDNDKHYKHWYCVCSCYLCRFIKQFDEVYISPYIYTYMIVYA